MSSRDEMASLVRPLLAPYQAAGVFRAMDVILAERLMRMTSDRDPLVALGIAAASAAPARGHVCFDTRRPLELLIDPDVDVDSESLATQLSWPDPEAWKVALENSPLTKRGPIVVEGSLVYLELYHRYQTELAAALTARAKLTVSNLPDAARLGTRVSRLFPNAKGTDRQLFASINALVRRLTVVTGGPGTGKTTTVFKLLVALVEEKAEAGLDLPRITLLAPTGKAAARLSAAIRDQKASSETAPLVLAAIPDEASTIHRQLKARVDNPNRFEYGITNPLPYDIVVCDEASMVDLRWMTRLVLATNPRARLILLGDRDQLASVEAGAVLSDICGGDEPRPRYSAKLRDVALQVRSDLPVEWFESGEQSDPITQVALPSMRDSIVELEVAHRFKDVPALGELASALRSGSASDAMALLRDPANQHCIQFVQASSLKEVETLLAPRLETLWKEVMNASDPEDALRISERMRIVCAHRSGPFGVEEVNRAAERWLAMSDVIELQDNHAARGVSLQISSSEHWYSGRPILITKNDYALGLMNGDTGLVLARDASSAGRETLRAHFHGGRSFLPGTLAPHETVFAMTIHKSQGSEFEEVIVALPPKRSPIMTRELLYTAATRAKARLIVIGTQDVFRDALSRRTIRASGLRSALW